MISPCFLGCLQRASLGRALQVSSAPCFEVNTVREKTKATVRSFTSIQMFHAHTHTHFHPQHFHARLDHTHTPHVYTPVHFAHTPLTNNTFTRSSFAHLTSICISCTHRSSTISCLFPALPIPSSPFFGYLLEEVDTWGYPVL